MFKQLLIAGVLLLLATPCFAADAGSVTRDTSSEVRSFFIGNLRYRSYAFDVTSDGSGDVAKSLGVKIGGLIDFVEVELDESDTPSSGFDFWLYTADSTLQLDLLGGAGVGLVNTKHHTLTPQVGSAFRPRRISDTVYLEADDMGNATKFKIRIFVIR